MKVARPTWCSVPVVTLISSAILVGGCAPGDTLPPGPHVIEDGRAQVLTEYQDSEQWIREEVWVETEFDSDGDGLADRVRASVTRPAQTDEGVRVPVIYETSPYYSGTAGIEFAHFWSLEQEVGEGPPPRDPYPGTIEHLEEQSVISNSHVSDWVPRGFAVVHSQSPGTGQSQGCPTVGGQNETLAPKAVIDWLNGRARAFTTVDGDTEVAAGWSTGKVGMTGTSYNGTLPLAAATTGVDGLEAIIPVAPNTSYYHYYRSNGLIRSPGGYPGEDVDVLFDFILSGPPSVREYCIENVRDGEMMANMDRTTGDYSDWWAGRDYLNHIDGVRAATLMSHGFNDWNVMPEHSYRISQALKERGVPVQIYYHQGGHGGPPPFELMNRWFTRYLIGGLGTEPAADEPGAWIVRGQDDRLEPTPYPDYPHPDAAGVTLRPEGDGNSVGTLVTARGDGALGTGSFTDDFNLDVSTLASADESPNRLLYATPGLAAPLHISGLPEVTVRMTADAPQANLSVWLVSLPWTDAGFINDNLITAGWADPTNAGAEDMARPRTSEPLTPGEFVDVTFTLQPDDQVIPAGAQIGLMIFSSNKNYTLHPEPGTVLTVDTGGTSLTLPVVGGATALEEAFGDRD